MFERSKVCMLPILAVIAGLSGSGCHEREKQDCREGINFMLQLSRTSHLARQSLDTVRKTTRVRSIPIVEDIGVEIERWEKAAPRVRQLQTRYGQTGALETIREGLLIATYHAREAAKANDERFGHLASFKDEDQKREWRAHVSAMDDQIDLMKFGLFRLLANTGCYSALSIDFPVDEYTAADNLCSKDNVRELPYDALSGFVKGALVIRANEDSAPLDGIEGMRCRLHARQVTPDARILPPDRFHDDVAFKVGLVETSEGLQDGVNCHIEHHGNITDADRAACPDKINVELLHSNDFRTLECSGVGIHELTIGEFQRRITSRIDLRPDFRGLILGGSCRRQIPGPVAHFDASKQNEGGVKDVREDGREVPAESTNKVSARSVF